MRRVGAEGVHGENPFSLRASVSPCLCVGTEKSAMAVGRPCVQSSKYCTVETTRTVFWSWLLSLMPGA